MQTFHTASDSLKDPVANSLIYLRLRSLLLLTGPPDAGSNEIRHSGQPLEFEHLPDLEFEHLPDYASHDRELLQVLESVRIKAGEAANARWPRGPRAVPNKRPSRLKSPEGAQGRLGSAQTPPQAIQAVAGSQSTTSSIATRRFRR